MQSIGEIPYGSDAYRTVLGYRDQILRRPLGLSLGAADTAGEECQRHFVIREVDDMLAGVIAVKLDARTFRLRQMWVRSDFAGTGLGRRLIAAVEQTLQAGGCERIILHARIAVRGFYEKCGYTGQGELFDEIGIPHITMSRVLQNNPRPSKP